jgi:hypothetical protein
MRKRDQVMHARYAAYRAWQVDEQKTGGLLSIGWDDSSDYTYMWIMGTNGSCAYRAPRLPCACDVCTSSDDPAVLLRHSLDVLPPDYDFEQFVCDDRCCAGETIDEMAELYWERATDPDDRAMIR